MDEIVVWKSEVKKDSIKNVYKKIYFLKIVAYYKVLTGILLE